MSALPLGTVTFLFADIEGSTRLLQSLGERYGSVVADFRQIMRTRLGEAGGNEVDTQGDAFFFSFSRAQDAAAGAVAAQRELAGHDWPDGSELKVRMAIHTGEPFVGDEGYHGLDVVRTARLCAAASGGQVLLSETTRALIGKNLPEGATIRDLGEHELKDVGSERVFELALPGQPVSFPALGPQRPGPGWDFERRAGELATAARSAIDEQVARELEKAFAEATSPRENPPAKQPRRTSLIAVALLLVTIVVVFLILRLA